MGGVTGGRAQHWQDPDGGPGDVAAAGEGWGLHAAVLGPSAPSAFQSAGQGGGLHLGSTLCPMAARPPEEASPPLPCV